MENANAESGSRTATVHTPLWKARVPVSMTPLLFFTFTATGLIVSLNLSIDALATGGPWMGCVAMAILLLIFFVVVSVVRLVQEHPAGLMGTAAGRRTRGATERHASAPSSGTFRAPGQ
jgi:hypothetical protein